MYKLLIRSKVSSSIGYLSGNLYKNKYGVCVMKTCFNEKNDFLNFQRDLVKLAESTESGCLIVFTCDENDWDHAQMSALFKQIDASLIGGIFPQIVFGVKHSSTGYLIVQSDLDLTPVVIHGLDDDSINFESLIDEAIDVDLQVSSMMIFVDGLSTRISSFVDSLFALFGADVRYIGGGAGSLSFEQSPCVFSNEGLFQGAAVIGLTSSSLAVEVGHGWEPIDKGHFVTRVEKNVVKEINYKNAFQVYQEILEPYLQGKSFTHENFFEIAQSFPLGIKKIDGDYVVRDPISVSEEGHLICVGELNEGDHIDILHGNADALIRSSSSIAERLYKAPQTGTGVFVMDCISRALFLEDRFEAELSAIAEQVEQEHPVFGALVLGEIANSGSGYLEFYNKTTVISLI